MNEKTEEFLHWCRSAGCLLAVAGAAVSGMADGVSPGAGSGIDGARYATDAYPGFDREDEIVKPERKEPKWLGFLFGPNRENAREQMEYCAGLIREENYSKAAGQLDALVREWPTAPEAAKAQQTLAEILLDQLKDTEEAFREYRYLLDFYSLQCDYGGIADKLYEVAGVLQVEGKEIMFVRFANTVDVRRAYEACVLHAPGAKWVPEAMLKIAALREEDGKYAEALKVYENLRNLHPGSDEALTALLRETEVRMLVLEDFGYNRLRCRDTIDFLRMALKYCREGDRARIQECLEIARAKLESEAFLGAKFYDSATRTKRSAISAYERYLNEYPEGAHAAEVRERLGQLKGE